MSQTPRNPFDSGADQFGTPAKKSSNTWLWVLGIIGGIFLVGAIACCGLAYFSWSKASGFIAEEVVKEYSDDPVIVEKIGTITSSEMNLGDAMTESSKNQDSTALVLDIRGDKGSGQLIHSTNQKTGEVTATLVMENGESFELSIVNEFEDFDAELEGLEDIEAMDEEIGFEVESGEGVTVEEDETAAGSIAE